MPCASVSVRVTSCARGAARQRPVRDADHDGGEQRQRDRPGEARQRSSARLAAEPDGCERHGEEREPHAAARGVQRQQRQPAQRDELPHARARAQRARQQRRPRRARTTTSSQLCGLSGAQRPMAWRAASLCSTPSTYDGVCQSAGLAHSASAEATITAMLSPGRRRAALEDEVRARDRGAREHGAVQVAPQREQRDEQPDAARRRARLRPQQQHAGGEQRQGEQLGADRDDRPEAGRQEQQQRDRERALLRAGAPARRAPAARASRPRPRPGRSAARGCPASRAARTRARRAPARSASRRWRAARRARRRGCRRGSRSCGPSSASHGPSAACTLSSAAMAVTASAASPPGRARARSGSPRLGRALMALNLVEPARRPRAPGVRPYPCPADDVNEPATPTQRGAGAHRAPGDVRPPCSPSPGRRLRARPGRALLVSAGVTVAVAFLVGVAGGSAVSEDLALRHALGSLPSAERALRIAWSGQVAHGRLRRARPHRAARAGDAHRPAAHALRSSSRRASRHRPRQARRP